MITSRYWTQVIYRNKEKFYNPVRQNYGHVKALQAVLSEYPNLKFIPIVVFSINSDLKTKTTSHVVYSTRLLSTIRQYRETVIDGAMKEDIAGRVSGLNIGDRAARAKHVVDIHSSIEANPALAAGENWSLGTERTDSLSAAQVSLNAGIPPLLKIWKAGT